MIGWMVRRDMIGSGSNFEFIFYYGNEKDAAISEKMSLECD